MEPLLLRLGDGEWSVHRAACRALGALGDPRAVEPLIDRLGNEGWGVRAAACEALGALGEGRLAGALVDALENKPKARAALAALTEAGDPRIYQILLLWMTNGSWSVRGPACRALGALGDPRAVEPLIDRLGDEGWGVRAAACEALGALHDPRAVAPLIDRLSDSQSEVRTAACTALGLVGEPRAMDPLLNRLGDRFSDVRQAACKALERLNAPRWPHLTSLLCTRCFTRADTRTVGEKEWEVRDLIVCRTCQRAGDLVPGVTEVRAVVDTRMVDRSVQGGGTLRVNWLQEGRLFDFIRVEIGQASEEALERFCMQVGNDTDLVRQPRYRRMPCTVAPGATLPPAMQNLLQHTFGAVTRRPVSRDGESR